MSDMVYQKRRGTSGVSGQLYETKLTALIVFRALHDEDIEEFYVGTNVDGLGEFDDICFRFKVRSLDKPIAIFLQAKHRDQNRPLAFTRADLTGYFKSYMNIRSKFDVNSSDAFFRVAYDNVECAYVYYTNTRDDLNKLDHSNRYISEINNYISTGDDGFQLSYAEENVELLNGVVNHEIIVRLAKVITDIYQDRGENYRALMNNELVQTYHVVLSRQVFIFDDDSNADYRKGSFKPNFFDAHTDDNQLLRNELMYIALKNRKYHGSTLDEASISIGTAYFSRTFKLPAAFGNRDLTLRGDSAQRERRLSHLATTVVDLLKKSSIMTVNKATFNIVCIDDDFPDKGFLRLNGGIAGAVGNLLVMDDKTRLLKFANGNDLTGDARKLFNKIESETGELEGYRFEVTVKEFPRLSFDCSEHDKRMVMDFTSKLLFYTNQARESDVEHILKGEIGQLQNARERSSYQIKSDAIFLKYHDEIQKWWMKQNNAEYLTKTNHVFRSTIDCFLENPLLSVLNELHRTKYMRGDIILATEVVDRLPLDGSFSIITIVVAEVILLAAIKVIQSIKNEHYIVMDLNYLLSLPVSDCNRLNEELMSVDDKIIIITYNLSQVLKLNKDIKKVLQTLKGKRLIVVTNDATLSEIRKCLGEADCFIVTDNGSLVDLTEDSQRAILGNAAVIFQGVRTNLNSLLDHSSRVFVKGRIMDKIMNEETIQVGGPLTNLRYEEIKDFFVSRRVTSRAFAEYRASVKLETFYDVVDEAVLITAEPGMGKSSLITHLSIKTKAQDPEVWIVRINLLDYSRNFMQWKENKVNMDILQALRFICLAFFTREDNTNIILEDNTGDILLKDCGDIEEDSDMVFGINLFLYNYNRRRVIFAFDGFDEICPHYEQEVIQFLTTLKDYRPRQHQIWLTSRTYSTILRSLQQIFDFTHHLQPFHFMEQEEFIKKYLKLKLDLDALNERQMEKINEFIIFMESSHSWEVDEDFRILYKCRSLPLHTVYLDAAQYFKDEIKCVLNRRVRERYVKAWDLNVHAMKIVRQYNGRRYDMNYMLEFIATPLHLYMTVDYFQNEIKHVETDIVWDLNVNTYMLYEHFVETKLRRIRFEEKNQMNLCQPDVRFTFERERTLFINEHKKLAAYAMFHEDIHEIFDATQLQEIRETVDSINSGREKTGVVNGVSHGVPRFVHQTFAEYFAVEYICDLLKTKRSIDELNSLWNFILNEVFYRHNVGILNILDDKLIMDEELRDVVSDALSKRVIFDKLMEQSSGERSSGEETRDESSYTLNSALHKAMSENLRNLTSLFLSSLVYINEDNIDSLVTIITETAAILDSVIIKNVEFTNIVLDIVRNTAPSKMSVLFDRIPKSCIKCNEDTTNEMVVDVLNRYMNIILNKGQDFFEYIA